ncbi:Peptidase M14, carboxypeptidase A precursor [hydrothermal vent metagenome]|uniref:Peptidase M14, carboxypeptidase A n=1 Tax=hydrothermal vent metagenome TaxID=652676 RepID=A0A3B0UAS7_9ZZZZ
MKKLLFSCTLLISFVLFAQELKSPSEFLGYELGTKFTRHHEVVDYYQYLASAASDRVQLHEYGKTNERRPLLLAYVTSAANMQNLENIRKEHLKGTKGEGNGTKAIVWLSYNVHGNESVSTEASMQTIYDLLTIKTEYLEDTVVLIDPCINPDGRDRYVNWYYENKNAPNNIDPNSKEHHEGWHSGRTNHYMFDLNRDWAWLTQVESQQRLKFFNKWLPHIHVDFHEQGVNEPYYFAPAAEPFHEVITDFQRDFQVTIGKNHAKYFDANGWFYFTKEVFDLLYPSYGDTYPTYNGGIGMTYEQGGSGRAGLAIKTALGDTLTLKDRIAHHYTTGISTVEVAAKHAQKLNDEFKRFYANKNFKYKSYVMNGGADKIDALTKLLEQHEIEFEWANQTTAKGYSYRTGKTKNLKTTDRSLVVQSSQSKSTLVKVLFEPNAKLSDSLTYDITAWSLPYAYGLDAVATVTKVNSKTTRGSLANNTDISENAYAYITDWNSMNDARFLAELLQNKIRVRYAQKPFSVKGNSFKRGSLIIARDDNKNNQSFVSNLRKAIEKHNKTIFSSQTGFVDNGKDFGSHYVQMVKNNKVAILSGGPTSTLQFGEIWHFFEQQLHYPLAVIDAQYIDSVDLSDYDVLVLPSGWGYKKFMTDDRLKNLKEWVSKGGKLIAMGGSIKSLSGKEGFAIKPKEIEKDSTKSVKPYDGSERLQINSAITGAIFKTKVDATHPLGYGYENAYFTLKLGNDAYEYLEKGNVVYLDESQTKPVSGFAGKKAQEKITETLVFGVENLGEGNVIYMVDNPLFRGFWENGKLFFANALFMVN